MKFKYAALTLIMIYSSNLVAKVDVHDVESYSNNLTSSIQQSSQNVINTQWNNMNGAPNEISARINWNNMPSGSICGKVSFNEGRIRSLVRCQGYNPADRCPSGFTQHDFGYYEAGNGTRYYKWCAKN